MRFLWKKLAAAMKIKKNDLNGTKQVFRFSLRQYFKSKSTYVMFIVMFIGTAAAVLLSGMGQDRGAAVGTDARMVYILNGSPYAADWTAALPGYIETVGIPADPLDSILDTLDKADRAVAVEINFDEDAYCWGVTAYTGKDSMVSASEAQNLAACCADALEEARYRSLGVSEEQIALALGSAGVDNLTEEDLHKAEEPDADEDSTGNYLVGFACSVLVFMLISFSTSFIVKAVAEEKNSKLVEVLMISVKPLALVAGKILAALVLVIVGAAASGVGLFLSRKALILLGYDGGSAVAGIGQALKGLSAGGFLVMLVSLVLGYLSFAVMSGISGAACSTVTESDQASSTVMLIAMIGYITGAATGFLGESTGMTVVSCIPFISPFVAPARYMNGVLPFWALPVSWVLQAITLWLLAKLCAGVYGALIFHRGERVKTKQILKMAKGGEKA